MISNLAQKYCGDCKNSFEELSKIIQKVMATRRELVAYDKKKYSTETMTPNVQAPGRCFGCAAASVEHCLTLLRALGMISHKKSLITICGHKHKIKNFIKNFDIFHEKNFNSF